MPDVAPTIDPRWPVMAAVRFALAMVVLTGHLSWFAPAGRPLPLTSLGGTSAVLGFLLISGYSIGHSLARRPAGFYRRRVARIYPLYAVAVVYAAVPYLTGASALAVPGNTFARPTAGVVAGNLLLVQNVVCQPIASDNLVWTLGVEAVFYGLAPWLRRWTSGDLLIVVFASAAAFAIYPADWPHYEALRFGLPHLLFAWAWVGGFLLHRWRANVWAGVGLAVLGGAALTANRAFGQRFQVETFVATAALVTVAGRLPVPRAMVGPLNYLGDLSYPLYLLHLPTFLLGYAVLSVTSPAALFAAAVAVSAAALFCESTLRPAGAGRRGAAVPAWPPPI